MIRRGSTNYPNWPWNQVWKADLFPRIKHFIWLAIHDRLSTAVRLYNHGGIESPICQICKQSDEIFHHLVFYCKGFDKYRFILSLNQNKMNSFAQAFFSLPNNSRKQLDLAIAAWIIWQARNKFIFEGKELSFKVLNSRHIKTSKDLAIHFPVKVQNMNQIECK